MQMTDMGNGIDDMQRDVAQNPEADDDDDDGSQVDGPQGHEANNSDDDDDDDDDDDVDNAQVHGPQGHDDDDDDDDANNEDLLQAKVEWLKAAEGGRWHRNKYVLIVREASRQPMRYSTALNVASTVYELSKAYQVIPNAVDVPEEIRGAKVGLNVIHKFLGDRSPSFVSQCIKVGMTMARYAEDQRVVSALAPLKARKNVGISAIVSELKALNLVL